MLMDPDAILRATEFLDDSMFYREGHRRIFRAMVALSERGDVVDLSLIHISEPTRLLSISYAVFCFLMIRRPPRSTLDRSSAASDVYKRQMFYREGHRRIFRAMVALSERGDVVDLSLIHISEPTRLLSISYAVFCLKKK